ncbi:SpoIIIAH-like family protein [Alkalihalobacillus sp. LMS39]|uniref:SpoIIIAH-like family protein n=1 Tax=Alkalihalobacillus sp. LMS39 TaxID=2924032 RepID=UPI001FB38646|nr:SpoIIIAH-like family protein [Alkalihalobacillus sp. LMS39]UOE95921.1 SpoIIIAH-like family protein [Alkalihalobacillus sp. LMS39]
MVLKRQTVWLLTMLSLIIVLSAYYMTSPGESLDYAYTDEEKGLEENTDVTVSVDEEMDMDMEVVLEEAGEGDGEAGMISAISSDETFTSLRLDRQVSRDKLLESYTNVMTSGASAEAIAEAVDKQEALLSMQQQEEMLETLVRTKGYEDVLVITKDDRVNVIVKADELSREEAVEILALAREQLGDKHVQIRHQASK